METDLDISVPRKAAVTVSSHRGDVNIVGRDGNVDISAQRSDTSVEDVTGTVKSVRKRARRSSSRSRRRALGRPAERSLAFPT